MVLYFRNRYNRQVIDFETYDMLTLEEAWDYDVILPEEIDEIIVDELSPSTIISHKS